MMKRIYYKWLLSCALVSTCLLTAGNAHAQVTVSKQNGTVKEMLKEIEQSSGYRFFYDEELNGLDGRASLSVDNVSVESAMEALLGNSSISWRVTDNNIIVLTPRIQQRQAGPQPSSSSAPQQGRVSGFVRDSSGEALIGVVVSVEGTSNAAISGLDGAYTLVNVPAGATLRFNQMGYTVQTIEVNNRTTIDVVMEEDTTLIDDVVVVGYGTQRRANLTGSVATVGAEVIENKVTTNLMTALTGEAAGLTIMNRSGQPGGTADRGSDRSMRVRGSGTFGDAEPLVLVDGMPMSMNDVHPNDVASVTVLKDAASAAIYGSRAANGVILITTKSGQAGKLRLSYNGSYGLTTSTRLPDMVNSWQFAEMWNEGMRNEGQNPDRFPDDMIARMKAGGNPDAQEGSTDWFKEVLNKVAPRHMHQVSATGGTDGLTYMASLGYDQQEGLIPNTPWERYSARINTRAKLTSWFDLGFNLSFQSTSRTQPVNGIDNVFMNIGRGMPFMPVKYSNGAWSFLSISTNPVRKVNGDYGLSYFDSSMTSIQLNPRLTLAKGLVVEGQFGYQTSSSLRKNHNKIVDYEAFEFEGRQMQAGGPDVARNQVQDNWNMSKNMTANVFATYDLNVADRHDFKFMLGASAEYRKYANSSASRYDLPSNEYKEIDIGSVTTAAAGGNSTYSSLASLFGRLNYAFDDKYLIEANFRYDGSSKFARGQRWGLYPSFSAGWRISEESFFEGLKSTVSNLKLRASWGMLGNQSIGDFQFLSSFDSNGFYVFDGQTFDGYRERRMGNTAITWETSRNFNIGLDFALFRNRLDVTFDWFNRETQNILLALPKPSTVGIGVPTVNAGVIGNKGWEFTLAWRDQLWGGKGGYRVAFNLSDVKNTVLDMAGFKSNTDDLQINREGDPMGALFGFETVGIAMREADYEKYHTMMQKWNPNWGLGDMILKDQDGNGTLDVDDKVVIGDPTPRYTFGLNLGFNYGKFDANLFLQGVGKADGYVVVEMLQPLNNVSGRVDHFEKAFRPGNPNYDATYPRLLATWGHNYASQANILHDCLK